jgi:phosphatidylglycerophosphatase A
MNNPDSSASPDLKKPSHLLAFGFGSGLLPAAPGTWGTLAAVPCYLLMAPLSLPWYLFLLALAFLAGIWICGQASKDLGVHDHGGIVWDEIVGYLVAMALVPATLFWVLIGFVLFRFFDILKPWPIGYMDRKIGGGLGIMLDDLLAGVYALLVMYLMAYFGVQL